MARIWRTIDGGDNGELFSPSGKTTASYHYCYSQQAIDYSCLEYSLSSLSIRSLLVSASSARRAEVFTPSPLLWVFSMMEQARNTKAGTVSCFSCLGISTSVQYCVSSLITSWKGKTVGSSGYRRDDEKNRGAKKSRAFVQGDWPLYSGSFYPRVLENKLPVHLSDAV